MKAYVFDYDLKDSFFQYNNLVLGKENCLSLVFNVYSKEAKFKEKIVFDFYDAVLSYRITLQNLASKTEDKIIEANAVNKCLPYTPLYSENDDYIDWYKHNNRLDEDECEKLRYFLLYDEDYFFEFIIDELPKYRVVKD